MAHNDLFTAPELLNFPSTPRSHPLILNVEVLLKFLKALGSPVYRL